MNVIFWDFDGTLVYSEHLWSGSMYRAIREIAPDTAVTFEAIRTCNRSGFTWQTPEADHTDLIGMAWWEYMYAHIERSLIACGATPVQAIAAAARTREIILHPESYHVFDDAVETLQALRERGYHHVILSNNYPELETVVSALGLLPYFDGIIVSALEGYDKPRRELFDIAKSRFPAERYYMVGDNPIADIVGGHQSGMTTILVHGGHHIGADHEADCLRKLLTIFP